MRRQKAVIGAEEGWVTPVPQADRTRSHAFRWGVRILLTLALILPLGLTTGTVAHADKKPAKCSDGKILDISRPKYKGTTIASVKQYWSEKCQSNWAYVWIWKAFRDKGYKVATGLEIQQKGSSKAHGYRWLKKGRIEGFSKPVKMAGKCTRARVRLHVYKGEDYQFMRRVTTSPWRCD